MVGIPISMWYSCGDELKYKCQYFFRGHVVGIPHDLTLYGVLNTSKMTISSPTSGNGVHYSLVTWKKIKEMRDIGRRGRV